MMPLKQVFLGHYQKANTDICCDNIFIVILGFVISFDIQINMEELHRLHQSVAKGLLPKSQEVHKHVKEFLGAEVKEFENFNRENDRILDKLKQEYDTYTRTINGLKTQLRKDHNFVEGSGAYLKAKEDELTAKKKVLDSISTGLKESVSKIKPENLAELPYQKENALKQMFQTLFHVLYNSDKSKYNWEAFKEKALRHYKGEDFLTRLANINFKEMPQNYYDSLLILRTSEQFKDACENKPYSYHIVDIADWVDYVCEGVKINKDKKQIEHDYHKILNDKEKRSGKSTQLKEQFCTETLKDIDNYQNNLMWLQSELRTLATNMNSSIQDVTQLDQNRNEAITRLNAI